MFIKFNVFKAVFFHIFDNEIAKAKGVFILAIEADPILSKNRARFVSVVNMGSLLRYLLM